MRGYVKVLLALVGGLLLVANGACALWGAAAVSEPTNSYAGLGPAVIGLLAFYGGVPAGLVALLLLAAKGQAVPARVRGLALLAGALMGVGLFWVTTAGLGAAYPPPFRLEWIGIVAFGASAVAALLFLLWAMRLPARPKDDAPPP